MARQVEKYESIYDRVMAEMQRAEELGGPDIPDYVQLMLTIALEATQRAESVHRRVAIVRYRR
jgi:hypothetical protein